MRDPARIPLILYRLLKVWQAHPDLRLGQLVVNGATVRPHIDPFYIEDEPLLDRLEALAKPAESPPDEKDRRIAELEATLREIRQRMVDMGPPVLALKAELARLESGARRHTDLSETHKFTFEDGVLSAVATIRKRLREPESEVPPPPAPETHVEAATKERPMHFLPSQGAFTQDIAYELRTQCGQLAAYSLNTTDPTKVTCKMCLANRKKGLKPQDESDG